MLLPVGQDAGVVKGSGLSNVCLVFLFTYWVRFRVSLTLTLFP